MMQSPAFLIRQAFGQYFFTTVFGTMLLKHSKRVQAIGTSLGIVYRGAVLNGSPELDLG